MKIYNSLIKSDSDTGRFTSDLLRISIILVLLFILGSCGSVEGKREANNVLIEEGEQKLLFSKLIQLTGNSIPEKRQFDSLAFLIIPIDASCNACRDKCIDTLTKNLPILDKRHLAIVTGNGMKAIKAYFAAEDKPMPEKNGQVFIDSENQSYLNDLVFLHPTFYYCYNGRVYKKVKTVPITIKEDLKEFFR